MSGNENPSDLVQNKPSGNSPETGEKPRKFPKLLDGRTEDLRGHVFGYLRPLETAQSNGNGAYWKCACVCGTIVTASSNKLKRNPIASCGCQTIRHWALTTYGVFPVQKKLRSKKPQVNKWRRDPATKGAWQSWNKMKGRCTNPKDPKWQRYGGRGIKVCERWRWSFPNFFADMGPKPPGYSIERINNDGNYEPGNCKWIPMAEQAANRSNVKRITADGQTKYLAEWAKHLGIHYHSLLKRIKKHGIHEAILIGSNLKKKTAVEAASKPRM